MAVSLGDKKEKRIKVRLSDSARTTLNPITRIPKKVVGINRFPSILKEGAIPVTKANVETAFKSFLKENREFFGVQSEDLKLKSVKKIREKWYAKFQQYFKGIPIYNAMVGLDASDRGKVSNYAANYHPKIDVPTEPKISLEMAIQTAKKTYAQENHHKLKAKDTSKIIYPEKTEKSIVSHLAWKFLLAAERPDPELEKYFIVDAIDGKIIFSYTARFPGAKVHGQVRGEIYPENPTDPISTEPLENENVSIDYAGKTKTNSSGNFKKQVPWYWPLLAFLFRSRARFRLEGPYVRVQDSNGADFIITRPCSTNNPCNHTWTMADRDHINVFYHMNLFRNWLKDNLNHNWVNPWDGSNRFNAEVNHPFANAYAGDPIQLGTNDFARSSDVIYHECTHNVLYELYGDYIGWPARYSEAYAMDEGFADYFAGSFTNDSRHGEGYGGTRDLDNNEQYPGKDTYNIEGHSGGEIIGGAAWDLRERLINVMGAQGASFTDNLIFDAHQILATYPRDYYFSDPQESNLLSSIYMVDDDNNNLVDGVPHFIHIHQAFASHNLLQAVLFTRDSFDFSANTIDELTGGDLYYYDGKFWANNYGQRGVKDLGDVGNVALSDVNIPFGGYTRFGVSAVLNHTYVSLAHQGEEGNYIVFRVKSISADKSNVTIEYYYRLGRLRAVEGVVLSFLDLSWGRSNKGDFYFKEGKFFSDISGQRGLVDLGDLGEEPLEKIKIPTKGFKRKGVPAMKGHTYVSLAKKGEEGHYIIFRVHSIDQDSVIIDFRYV